MERARLWWTIAATIVGVMAMVAGGVVYTNQTIRHSEQKWCDLLIMLDSPIPPNADNPRAQSAAVKLRELRINFGC